jgi:hypothetical protein
MPVTVPQGSTPKAGSGVTASLTAVTRSDGTMQVAAGGNPLYYYAGDSGPGQTSGQGISSFGGIWYAVQASGQPAKSAGGSATPSPSSGYGY